jgi:hypothetical protein
MSKIAASISELRWWRLFTWVLVRQQCEFTLTRGQMTSFSIRGHTTRIDFSHCVLVLKGGFRNQYCNVQGGDLESCAKYFDWNWLTQTSWSLMARDEFVRGSTVDHAETRDIESPP